MTDYSSHRLNDDSELKIYMADMPRYLKFVRRVYALLDALAIGEGLEVAHVVKPENLDVFIKVVCCYIIHMNPIRKDSFIEFNKEYTIIIRRPNIVFPPHRFNFYDKK